MQIIGKQSVKKQKRNKVYMHIGHINRELLKSIKKLNTIKILHNNSRYCC